MTVQPQDVRMVQHAMLEVMMDTDTAAHASLATVAPSVKLKSMNAHHLHVYMAMLV